MMNMAYGTVFGPMHGVLYTLCYMAIIALTVGVVFLTIWAAKNLSPAKLLAWGIGLVVAGGLVCLAVGYFAPQNGIMPYRQGEMLSMMGEKNMMMDCMMKKDAMNDDDMPMMGEKNMMMDCMMKKDAMNDDDMPMMGHSMGNMMMEGDAMNMSMNDMSEMLKGKTGDDFDKAFLEGMIPHHQGAIDMAREVLRSAKHDDLKRLARDIITAQQKEIDMMNDWLKEWGYAN